MKEIVIKLSDEEYLDLISFTDNYIEQTLLPTEQKVVSAIKHGTPLPKGHGRLGDIDELYMRIGNFIYQIRLAFDVNTIVFMKHILDGIKQTDTIIEADKKEVSKT